LALSVASTVVLTRVLSDRGELHTATGRIAVGWLIVEDVFTVVVLVLLPELVGDNAAGFGQVAAALALALGKMAALVVLTLVVGQRVVPWVFGQVAATRSRELFTLTVLVVALGIAVGSAKVFGVSMALGAFLAGMIVGRTEFSLRAAVEALPMRDAFAVLFFVASGLLFDPAAVLRTPWAFLATSAIVLVSKPLAALVVLRWLGQPLSTGLAVGLSLGQIGEFSFILATLGRTLDVLPEAAVQILVGTALLTMTLNPFLMGTTVIWNNWYRRSQRGHSKAVLAPAPEPDTGSGLLHRAVVVGYGPVGQSITRLLRENGVVPTVVELNLETVRRLQAEGFQAVYGDADRQEVLVSAGVADAKGLILSASGLTNSREIIRCVRELNPEIRILVRAHFASEGAALRGAGATAVVVDESEVALGCIEVILRELGATAEQIDRERDRLRASPKAER
ncbi:MAG: sodium:proton exchanger, partial [Planctomycetaceae bacterium]